MYFITSAEKVLAMDTMDKILMLCVCLYPKFSLF